MPNFDGGHYFLTVLFPVRTDLTTGQGGEVTSHVHELRSVLASLPTALQSPETEAIGVPSPFARNLRTHFARFAVVDDVMFNGRTGRDALLVSILNENPVIPRALDQMPCPYLIFAADFDAADGSGAARAAWLRELWGAMEKELRAILAHCVAFDSVTDATSFAAYVARCQVETTMPFNDYWPGRPPLTDLSRWVLAAPLIPGGLVLLIGLLHILLSPFIHVSGWRGVKLTLLGLVLTIIGLGITYAIVMFKGEKPFPAAPNCDLRSVLKSLYLQQTFTRFAIDTQGADPASLHAAFTRFLADHRPDDVAAPTQPPGVIRA